MSLLTLRTGLLSKNVTFLKCIKGRSLITATNKKTPETRSTAVSWRSRKENTTQPLGALKTEQTNQLPALKKRQGQHKTLPLRYCMSCPNLVLETGTKHQRSPRFFTTPRTTPVCHEPINPYYGCSAIQSSPVHTSCLLKLTGSQITFKRAYSKPCSCGCPCPFPCGPCGCTSGCGCLPPPSNQPPRCIQYMTGYYYYPYGYWFCGPYHVTGICAPVGQCESSAPAKPSCDCGSKSPAPASVCSAATAIVDAHTPTVKSEMSSKAKMCDANLNFPTQETKCDYQARSGIAKFFPFNTTVTPGFSTSDLKNGKRPPSPIPSALTSAMCCKYSTRPPNKNFSKNSPNFCAPHITQHIGNNFSNYTTRASHITKSVQSKSFSKSASKTSNHPCPKSFSDYENTRAGSRSPIRHKRSRKYIYDVCPILEKPRLIMTREERDQPEIRPGLFHYSSIPQYRSPYPQPVNLN